MAKQKMAYRKSQLASPIFIKGAKIHNLKNIDVSIPRNSLVVITGVSGSGKSSLAIDTLYAEGQRRYAESLSAYARQFLVRMDKPEVDYIKGICPAIAIEQKVAFRTPRSTVGSMTEIYDYLRLLYARIGKTYSPKSGELVQKDEISDIVDFIRKREKKEKIQILIPLPERSGRSREEELKILLQKGFNRIYQKRGELKGKVLKIEDVLDSETIKWEDSSSMYVVIDRLVVKDFEEDELHRLADSIQTAFYENEYRCIIEVDFGKIHTFSGRFEKDGMDFEEPVPNLFSFNNPLGACPKCEGFGQVLGIDPDLVIPNKSLSVYEGAIACWHGKKMEKWNKALINSSRQFNFPIHTPIEELTTKQQQLLWDGNAYFDGIRAFFKMIEENLYKVQYRVLKSRFQGRTSCPECSGKRLRKEALYVRIGEATIADLVEMPVKRLRKWFQNLELSDFDAKVAKRLLLEIDQRLKTLDEVGLGYLTLNRPANTLSGGESQRIQLTRFLGSNLTDSLYILDEPSIGLHSRDTDRLIGVLQRLKALNNTVIVVEHDEAIMKAADYIIDMGPLASHLGGEVIFSGTYQEILKDKDSLTGRYLKGELKVEVPKSKRKYKNSFSLEGCKHHNLKNIEVKFPLGSLSVVSGVSGSGKTSLVKDILYPAIKRQLKETSGRPGNFKALKGDYQKITQIELVDQNPIGKSSRSNPVTYIKAYDAIRRLYASQQLSKMRGFKPKHFSFNVDGGRCDTCKGEGETIVEMQFLADVRLLCESCRGKRFKEEVLEVKYKGKSIYEVLEMSVDEAITFFAEEKEVSGKLQPLSNVGLGYIKLGQSSNTLSGGEAQRIKLASFLGKKRQKEHVLFIFDEPTTGLHFNDIKKLLTSLNALIDQGNTVVVVEHNLDVIKNADYLIELGPEGGEEGGYLLYQGKPGLIKEDVDSPTSAFL